VLRSRILLASAAAALWSSLATAQTKFSLEQDAIAFGTRETTTNMDLSPDGNSAVFLGAGPGKTTIIYVADLQSGTTKRALYSNGDPESFEWCRFVSNVRLACRYSAIIKSDVFGQNGATALVGMARTISVTTDGTDIKQLGQTSSDADIGLRQDDGRIIDWMPGASNDVLMTRLFVPEGSRGIPTNVQRTKSGTGIVRLDVETLVAKIVEPPRDGKTLWMSDGQGAVRLFGVGEIRNGYTTGRSKYSYRSRDSRDWVQLTDYVSDDEYVPLAIDGSIDALYALRKRNGRLALTKTSLSTSVESLVADNPRVDIDGIVRSGVGQKIIGYTYAEGERRTVYFDPEFRSLSDALGKALPGGPAIDFVKTSEDGTKILLFAGSDRDPGRYYLYNKSTKSLGEVMSVRPNLAGRELAEVKSITYAADDGTSIPAYLTLPPGKIAKGLPSIVLPHGGPSSRDEWGFDWLAQFLVARGYAVIQPQYRGSGGFGDAWLAQNGFKGWRTSIGDISAAARYLAKEGIADPGRMGIVGWSYGGYAALQSAAVDRTLFKAVVAIAPVTDFNLLKAEGENYTSYREVAAMVGDGPHLVEGSPLRRAASIQAPVLIAHGDLDLNVGISHSRRMHAALQTAGKESELLSFKGLDHQLQDNEARAQVLLKMGQLLERTIGR